MAQHNNNLSIEDSIFAYTHGTLVGDDLKAFEEKLANDPELAQEVLLYKQLTFIHKNPELITAVDNTKQWRADSSTIQPDFKALKRWEYKKWGQLALKISAGLVILGIAIWGIYQLFKEPTKEQPPIKTATVYTHLDANFKKYFEPYESSILILDEGDCKKGMVAYDTANYHEAIRYLTQCTKQANTASDFSLYLGIAYLNDTPPNPDKAIDAFNLVLADSTSTFKPVAHYYAINAEILRGDRLAALNHAELLKNNKRYATKIGELINILSSLKPRKSNIQKE